MDPGNTLGAIVFLAAGTWLGWKVVQGRATGFLTAVAGGGSSNGSGRTAAAASVTQHGGPLAGVDPTASSPFTEPMLNVFSDVFGQNGSLYGSQYEGQYGPYSPNVGGAYAPDPNLSNQVFRQAFGLPPQ
jgi:hypothetical protein